MYGFVLGPLQFQSTGQNTHLTLKTAILPVLAFKKNSTHLHSNQPKLSPVSESSTHPLQNYVCFFPLTSRPGLAGPTSPKSELSTVPLPDNCVMTPAFLDGSLPFQYAQKHSSPLRQALHNKEPTVTFNKLENLFSAFCFCFFLILFCFFSVGGFLQSSAARQLERATGHMKGTRPLVDSGCHHGKV